MRHQCHPMVPLPPQHAGWAALREMAQEWGRPPSTHALLAALRGMAQQLAAGGALPLQLLDTALQACDDLAATSSATRPGSSAAAGAAAAQAPAVLPPLDAALCEAALGLLLACYGRGAGELKGQGGAKPVSLEARVLGLLGALCTAGAPLSPALCWQLVEAMEACPGLGESDSLEAALEWEYGRPAVEAIMSSALEEASVKPLVLRRLSHSRQQQLKGQQRQRQQQQPPLDEAGGEVGQTGEGHCILGWVSVGCPH